MMVIERLFSYLMTMLAGSKLETSLTDEERSLIDNMSPTGVRLVRSSGANIDAMVRTHCHAQSWS